MKRTAGALVLLAAVGGCVTMDQRPSAGGGCGSCRGWSSGPATVPGVQGPWGQPVAMAAPYSASPPGAEAARAMMARSVPMELLQAGASAGPGTPSGIMLAGGPPAAPPPGGISPPGVPFQPIVPGMGTPAGAVAAVGALTGPTPNRFPTKRTEVRFLGPDKMKVSWFGHTPDGSPAPGHIDVPGRYNFVQAAVYRLKLSDIPGLPGVELYPTLEVVPANAKTEAFLAHSAVPVSFTNEDFEQVQAGNYLVKVVYLPDPQFQDLASAGPDEVVSSRLEPGADPLAEAHRRGNILLVIRLGNIDLDLATSPAMDAPSPYWPKHAAPGMPGQGMAPGMPTPGSMTGGRPMMIMGPNGPLMVGPNGQIIMGPSGHLMGAPTMQQVPTVPADGSGGPSTPATKQTGPVSQLPNPSLRHQTQYEDSSAGSTAELAPAAGQVTIIEPSEDKKPVSKRHWWWPGSGFDKQ